jgi:hypothetical protein
MKKQFITEPSKSVPTANIAVNKSRVKLYEKDGDMPTYYLQKGQEFQIELYNPTQGTVLAKISLNNTSISQGGLVLKPGQRVFLDRYLDVAKKFLFDTYEVSNSEETKKAIEKNGDFKVEFFKEQLPVRFIPSNGTINLSGSRTIWGGPNYNDGTFGGGYAHTTLSTNIPNGVCSTLSTNGLIGTSSTSYYNANITNCSGSFSSSVTTDALGSFSNDTLSIPKGGVLRSAKKSKSIETGRVEQGSDSDQKFKTSNKDFEYYSFHTIECKMLPVSQKINTAEDINVKRYCTNCGAKLGKTDKFCSSCGTKA